MAYPYQRATRSLRQQLSFSIPLPVTVAAGVYLLLLLMGDKLLNDPDTYWQVTLGDWIMAHRQVPRVDVFSYTMAGEPWISSQWLAQVIFAGLREFFGWSGPVLVTAAAAAAAFGLLAQFLRERLPLLPVVVLLAAAFILTAPHLVARPHVLALPVMVAWVAGLVRAVEQGRSPGYALLPLMTLWANLHGGFTFGIVLLGPIALEAMLQASPGEKVGSFFRWATFGVLAVLAACVTPYGPESVLVTGRILGLGPALQIITEWRPQDFGSLTGFAICLLGGLGMVLYRGLTLPPVRLLLVLLLLYMALSAVRNAELLGLLAPLFMARPLAPQLGESGEGREAESGHGRDAERDRGRYGAAALLFALAGISLGATWLDAYRPSPVATPTEAVAALRASGKQRVLNGYDFGGYLIYAGVRPFVDGRTELYGTDFMLRYDRAVRLEDVDALFELLDAYDVDAVLLDPRMPALGLIGRLEGWTQIYGDDIAVVYTKSGPTASGGKLIP